MRIKALQPTHRQSGAILSLRRAAHLHRWTDERNQEHRITQTKNGSHQAAPRIGVTCVTSGSDSREGLSRTAARMWSGLRSAASTRGTSRRSGHVSVSGLGVVRSGRRPARTSWLSRAAARQRRKLRRSGTVDAPGLLNASAITRSRVAVTRVVGLVSNGELRSPG